jgi:peroxiredoxin Q/BCP
MLKQGDRVPDFSLEAGTGKIVDKSSLLGHRWVIYFYPKDNTPGCTIETGEFGKALPEFARQDVQVFGCSVGGVEAKAKFAESCGAPDLPLLADVDHQVAEFFGVWKSPGGVARATFLIGADGRVERAWESVRPAGHAAEVLKALE